MPAHTKVLLHMDGPDASTVFADGSGKVWTPHGNAQVDTAQYKFGGASGYFDGAGDYLSTPNHADFDFGTGNWTVETWIRRNGNSPSDAGLLSASQVAGGGWLLILRPGNTIECQWNSGAKLQSPGAITDLTWTHVAAVRYGNTASLYIAGTSVDTDDCTGDTINSSALGMVIGRIVPNYDGYYYKGWIDEVRVSKGIARWTANFTPPTRAYGKSALICGWF